MSRTFCKVNKYFCPSKVFFLYYFIVFFSFTFFKERKEKNKNKNKNNKLEDNVDK